MIHQNIDICMHEILKEFKLVHNLTKVNKKDHVTMGGEDGW